jgi:hypothetical protein
MSSGVKRKHSPRRRTTHDEFCVFWNRTGLPTTQQLTKLSIAIGSRAARQGQGIFEADAGVMASAERILD